MRHRLLLLIILIYPCFNLLKAQNFEWLKTYSGKSTTETIQSINSSDKCISLCIIDGIGTKIGDSISFDQFKFSCPQNGSSESYLLKNDSAGKVVQVKKIGNFKLKFSRLTCDNEGSIYLMGYLNGIDQMDSLFLDSAKGRIVFLKYNSELKLTWWKQTGNSVFINSSQQQGLIFTQNRLYFMCQSKGYSQIGSFSLNLSNSSPSFVVGEINLQNGDILWAKCFYSPSNITNFRISDLIRISNSIYFSGDFSFGNKEIAIIQGDTFIGPGGFIIRTDTNGNYLQRWMISNERIFGLNCISSNEKELLVGGRFKDSLNWSGNFISPQYPSGSSAWNSQKHSEAFIAALSLDLKPKWFYRPKIEDKSRDGLSDFNTVSFCNGFFYFGGSLRDQIWINNHLLGPPNGSISPWILKIDPIGNILWSTIGYSSGGSVLTIYSNKSSVYTGGGFVGKLQFGLFQDSAKPFQQMDAFLTKITDYDITRGPVKSGPYCAGDTILVPYTHIGDFDTSNYFIAELSDEYGSFEGGERELGRIKTNLDSVVPGILPLFQVASSGEYRIRIRSTSPAIQSYYILDSLRLLIYSRDKANPGPPDTICFRDTAVLETFGGTKWSWSPAYHMDDSSLRTPRIWPEKDCVYRIIIADSSGCGAPDTAFKQIVVKPRPRLFGDSIVYKCNGVFLRVKLFVTNSDSGHTIRWYRNNKLYFTGDSMFYVDDANTILMAVLNDHCSPVKDTFLVRVFYNPPSKLLPFADTIVCFNASVALSAQATGGYNYQYNWFDSKNNFIGQGSPAANLVKADSFNVILSDACLSKADSAWKRFFLLNRIYPQMDAILQDDTLFCHDFSLNLIPYGVHSMDTVRWTNAENNSLLSSAQTLTVNTAARIAVEIQNICGTSYDSINIEKDSIPQLWFDSLYAPCQGTTLSLNIKGHSTWQYRWSNADTTASSIFSSSGNFWAAASNRCGADTAFFAVQFISKPKALFLNPDVCEGETFSLENTGSGGQTFLWRLGDGSVYTLLSPTHLYTRTGQARTYLVSLLATASKDCSDSITLPVNVLVSPNADFIHSSQEKTVFFNPIETPSGASYRWTFGDGDSSSLAAPSHTYKADSGTYTVCLKVTNAEGCAHVLCKQVHFNVSVSALQKSGFVLFPNPTVGEVHIRFKESGLYHIEISDVLGRVVYASEVSELEHTLQLPMRGTYFIKVRGDGWQGIEKLVVW